MIPKVVSMRIQCQTGEVTVLRLFMRLKKSRNWEMSTFVQPKIYAPSIGNIEKTVSYAVLKISLRNQIFALWRRADETQIRLKIFVWVEPWNFLKLRNGMKNHIFKTHSTIHCWQNNIKGRQFPSFQPFWVHQEDQSWYELWVVNMMILGSKRFICRPLTFHKNVITRYLPEKTSASHSLMIKIENVNGAISTSSNYYIQFFFSALSIVMSCHATSAIIVSFPQTVTNLKKYEYIVSRIYYFVTLFRMFNQFSSLKKSWCEIVMYPYLSMRCWWPIQCYGGFIKHVQLAQQIRILLKSGLY